MPGPSNDAFAEIVNLLAAPIASGIRAADQLRHGVDEMIRAVENMNRTMENLNEAATRVNALLSEVEAPVRAMMPQLTRTVTAADALTKALDPARVTEVLNSVGDLAKRLAPLANMADNAGGLLGAMGGLGGLRFPGMGAKPANPIPPPGTSKAAQQADKPADKPVAKKAPAKRAAKRATPKQSPAKKAGR
jgi:ABC-type transporter Mla subunit MlaD